MIGVTGLMMPGKTLVRAAGRFNVSIAETARVFA